MKKTVYRGTTILFITILVISCGEDYLNVPPQGSLDENSIGNPDGVFKSLVSTYSLLDGKTTGNTSEGATGSNWLLGSVASDDAYLGSTRGDQSDNFLPIELYKWNDKIGELNFKFINLYEGIKRANATLRLMNEVEELLESDRKSYEGEMKFLRAFYHFEAYKIWGDIPYYFENDLDFKKTKSNPFPVIIEDLITAIKLLPENQEAHGRVTKGVAQAFLGKVYLYDKEFEKAKLYFDLVESSGKYFLQESFHSPFSVNGENGSEMMFAFQASVNDGASFGANNNPDVLNFPNGPFGCCGFHQPSQNLVNAFKVDENGLPLLDNFNDKDLDSTVFVDPRLDWTVGRDGVPFLNWGMHDPTWIRDRDFAGPFSPKKSVYHQGAEESGTGPWLNLYTSLNFHIMRYADVLLMLAECEVELNNLNRARELVNRIRMRAGNYVQGVGTDLSDIETTMNDPNITWAKYRIGMYENEWTDEQFARKAVRFERRLELAMEGHRLFDLRRWEIAEKVINDYLDVEKEKREYLQEATLFEEKHKLYPFPEIQVLLSKVDTTPQIEQNPGY